LAYKAVRSGKQKKLDERAIKNEEMFKKLDLQLEGAHKKIDFAALNVDAKVTEVSNDIGVCPISQ
jgi:hypothetical protein